MVGTISARVNPVIVVMGVAGSGKSRIGRALAARCGFSFVEGDDLHPKSNVERMSQGIPLDDANRKEWLSHIAAVIASADPSTGLVVTCSALKRSYRDQLRAASDRVVFLHLAGDRQLIKARMTGRRGHFMPPSLLDSQFDDLEPPQPAEPAITLDAAQKPEALVEQARRRLVGTATARQGTGLGRIGRTLSRLTEWTMAALLVVMVVLVFGNAAGRYLFATGFAASEEVSRLAFVWLIFLGAVLAVRERAHVGVDMLVQRFGPMGKKISLAAMNLLILYALWLFAKGSWQQTLIGMESTAPVTGIPLAVYAVAGLICAVAMAVLFVIDLVRLFAGRVSDEELIQVRETPVHDEVLIATNGKAKPVHASTETFAR